MDLFVTAVLDSHQNTFTHCMYIPVGVMAHPAEADHSPQGEWHYLKDILSPERPLTLALDLRIWYSL